MTSPLTKQAAIPLRLASLVNTAQEQTTFSGLSEILHLLADTVGAYACILWRGADFESEYLFALAQWSADGKTSDLHYLSRTTSATGAAVASGETRNVTDLKQEPLINISSDSFFTRAKIENFCSVPIRFSETIDGALNFYRNVAAPFDEDELKLAEHAASLVPSLYQIIRDRVGLSLIGRVNDLLHEESSSDAPLDDDEMKRVMKSLCDLLRDTFQCLEVSVFLGDKLDEPANYDLFATTWPADEEFPRDSYQRKEDSLTGWVLANAQPVRIFDLARFEDDADELRRTYPNLIWEDSLKIQTAFRHIFNLKATDPLPPLSYMAAPIMRGNNVRGVVRSCVALEGPFYFGDKEIELLELIAGQIGYYWSNWLGRRGLQRENDLWKDLVIGVANLNSFVQKELSKPSFDEKRIFEETLKTTRSVLKGADINDVRLFDEDTRQLRFVAFDGEAWNEGTPSEIEKRKNKLFSVDETPPRSAGAYVFQTGEVYLIPNVNDPQYHYTQVFRDTRRKIVAPIGIKSKFYGVLDIRGTGPHDFPPHAKSVAQLLGQQLGLYHYWAEAIANLRKLDKEQIQVFQDVEHQLKSPVNLVYRMMQSFVRNDLPRLQLLLSDEEASKKLNTRFLEMRGVSRKAKRVAKNMRLFAYLAQNKPIPLRPKRLNYENLVRILIDAAKDNGLVFDPIRRIAFFVEPQGFEILNTMEVQGDLDLIEQAVMNLLDNAGKYSFNRTTVRVNAEATQKNQFCIRVANIGVPMRANEVQLAPQRGWRSEKAAWTTGEGSGIGLWIADHIMQAHNGELLIIPTNIENLTEVKLIFANKQEPR